MDINELSRELMSMIKQKLIPEKPDPPQDTETEQKEELIKTMPNELGCDLDAFGIGRGIGKGGRRPCFGCGGPHQIRDRPQPKGKGEGGNEEDPGDQGDSPDEGE